MGESLLAVLAWLLTGVVGSAVAYLITKYKYQIFVELNKRLEGEIEKLRLEKAEDKKRFDEELERMKQEVQKKLDFLDKQTENVLNIQARTIEEKEAKLKIQREQVEREQKLTQELNNLTKFTGTEGGE